jgi:hypothetical protein
LEPLKTDVELLNPQDMETAMSLARAYEQCLAIIAEANKVSALKPRRLPQPKVTMTTTTVTMATTTTMGVAAPTSRSFKRLTAKEMAERCHAGLRFNCDEPFAHGHKCKLLFDITAINDYDLEEADNSLKMMIGRTQSGVQGTSPMYLEGVINGVGVLVLVDSGLTHNVIEINVAHSIGLREQRINTTILVGSGNEVTCYAASFNVPLRIDSDAFDIDAYLLNITYDFDVVLGTPWLASLGRVVFDFTDMELQYIRNGRKHTFHATLRRQAPTTVLALPAPPPMVHAAQTSPPLPPSNVMNRS